MKPHIDPPARVFLLASFCLAFLACSGQSSCGCEGMSPLPQQFPEERKVYDGVQARLTSSAFDFITANFSTILGLMVPGGLSFDVPSNHIEEGCVFGWCAIDTDLCPQGCTFTPALSNVSLNRIEPDTLQVNITLDLNGMLYLRGSPDCDIELHIAGKQLSVPVTFRIDGLTYYLFFEITPPEVSISTDDVDISGDFTCDIADWGPVKGFIIDQLNSQLRDQLNGAIQEQLGDNLCLKCADAPGGCPQGSTCNGEICDEGGRCVPAPLGMSGRIDLAVAMKDIPAQDPGYMDIYLVAGQKEVNVGNDPIVAGNGVDLRLMGGGDTSLSPCVPPDTPAPDVTPPPRVGFGETFTPAAGGDPQPFMAGLGVSDTFLDGVLWAAWGAGALCIMVDTETSGGLLTSDALGLILPSLRQLTNGKTVSVMLVLRPQKPPSAEYGKGILEQDPADPEAPPLIRDPVVVINLKDLAIDFYAFLEERYVRLFTAVQDLAIPLGLEFTPENEVIPIIGDLSGGITNMRIESKELLAESSDALGRALPTLIAAALPQLTRAISAQQIPPIQGFKLTVKAAQGEVPKEGTDPQRFRFLAIYADLALAQAALLGARTRTRIDSVETGRDGEVSVRIETIGGPGLEYQFNVDGAGWSPFKAGRFVNLRSPMFRLYGAHEILARARYEFSYRTLDPSPQRLALTIAEPRPPQSPAVGSPNENEEPRPAGCSTFGGAGFAAAAALLACLLASRRRKS